jgi:4-aminobutyrate aminotransferase
MLSEQEYAKLSWSNVPSVKVTPPGPKAKAIIERCRELETKALALPFFVCQTAWEDAMGATIRDVDGNTYIDLSSHFAVMGVGHVNPEVTAALKKQADKLWHCAEIPTQGRVELLELIHELAPPGLKGNMKVLASVTGTDAIEGAVKIARFNKHLPTIIAFEGGYHGAIGGAMALSAKNQMHIGFHPLMPGVFRVPYAYCYRCPFGDTPYPECNLQCVKFIERFFKDSEAGLDSVAAMVLEPIQGEGGYIVPPKEFLPEMARICKQNNVLLIVDEVQSGVARTGKMWACMHSSVEPDIMPISKAMGAGTPIAAVMWKKELDTWPPGSHKGTYRWNMLTVAASVGALRFIKENRLWERADKLGNYAIKKLHDLLDNSKIVGDIRGKGLLIGVEFVKDKKTKEPMKLIPDFTKKLLDNGVTSLFAGHFDNVLRVAPPLIISQDLLDKALDITAATVKEFEKKV